MILTELASVQMETPDAIGWCPHAVVVEVKVSRADLLRDAKKPWRQVPEIGLGTLRYYLSPPGIVEKEDLPENWGLLWASEWPNVELMVRAEPQLGNDGLTLLLSAMRRLQWEPNGNVRVKTYKAVPTNKIQRATITVAPKEDSGD